MDYTSKINYLDYLDQVSIVDDNTININTKCLISHDDLDSYGIELSCGHKFNYIPLINDIFKQIFVFAKINNIFFCCPYCRQIEKKILPYYKELNVIKIYNVNCEDKKYKININQRYDNKLEKKCGKCCYNLASKIECLNNDVYEYIINDKFYCLRHLKLINRKYFGNKTPHLKPFFNELNEDKDNKVKKKKIVNEFISCELKCNAILKSGPNKGKHCCNNKKEGNFCLKHAVMNN
jgi:hypothetical protein